MATSATHVHDHDSGEGLLSVEDAREKVLSQVQALATIDLADSVRVARYRRLEVRITSADRNRFLKVPRLH